MKVIESQENVQDLNSSIEKRLLNEIELLKSKETSIINDNLLFKQDNKGYLEKIINLEQELSTLKINRSQLNESIKKECNDLEKLLKEKAIA